MSLLDTATAAGSALAGWVFPVQRYTLTQRFGTLNARDGAGGHKGIDMAAPLGTPVLAAADGPITFSGDGGGFGPNYVTQNAGGLELGYGHMKAAFVRAGQQVKAGQIIGLVGNEGVSTGPHLHFQIKQGGTFLDPLAWLQGKGAAATAGTPAAPSAVPASNSSGGVVGALLGALLGGVEQAAVKGLLVLGGGAMVVLGVAATARRTATVRSAESSAKSAASAAAMAA